MAEHIKIGDISPRIQYTGDGAQTVFTYPFPIFSDADIKVYVGDTLQTITTHYTVTGAGADTGGTITFVAAPLVGDLVTLIRDLTVKRESDFQESGEFRAKVINDELDKIIAMIQEVEDDLGRGLFLSTTDTANTLVLPTLANRVSKYLAFDANGDPIAASDPGSYPASAFMATVLDDVDAEAARTTLGLVINTDVLSPTGDGSGLTGVTAPTLDTFRNRIINGVAPYINQRGAITAVASGDYSMARWQYSKSSVAVFNSDVVASGGDDWIEVDVTTIDASVDATDYAGIQQSIEANNVADFKLGTASAATVTLSFKHKHTKTGVHCVALTNAAYDRYYVFEYTQSVADTEETHTETIALDTAGTWLTGTSTGLIVRFAMIAGTDRQAAAGVWATGNKWVTANQVNNFDSIANFFRIRAIQIDPGSTATDPEVLPYDVQLARCQRYYWRPVRDINEWVGNGQANGATTALIYVYPPSTMRADPSLDISNVSHFSLTANTGGAIAVTNITVHSWSDKDVIVLSVTVAGGLTAGDATALYSSNASAFLGFDGEL